MKKLKALKVNITFQSVPKNGEPIDYRPLVDCVELLLDELENKDVCEKEEKSEEISKED